jgi:hypothetical protein
MIDKIKQILNKLDRTAEHYVSHIIEIIENENHQ